MSRRAFLAVGMAAAATGASATPAGRLRLGHATGGFDFTIHNLAEANALVTAARSTPSLYAGKTVGVIAGNYGTAPLDFSGITLGSPMILYGSPNLSPLWPGVNFYTKPSTTPLPSTNIVLTRVTVSRLKATDPAVGTVIDVANGCTNISIIACEISADPMATFDFNYYANVTSVTGIWANNDSITTSNGQTGTYITGQPMSSGSVFAIINSTGTNTGAAGWNGATITSSSGGTAHVVSNASTLGTGGGVLIGIHVTSGTATNLVVTDNYIHDVRWPVAGVMTAASYQRNICTDIYTNFGDFDGDISGSVIKDNRCAHIWSYDGDGNPGTSGPHSSLFGFSQSSTTASNVTFQGNVMCVGWHRNGLTPTWWPAVNRPGTANGPKMNDMGAYTRARIDDGVTQGTTGNVMTVEIAQSGDAPITTTMYARWPGGPDAGVAINTLGTGTGLTGTYILASSFAVPTGTQITITARCINWFICNNLLVGNGSLGFEHAYCQGNTFLYNTIISAQDNIIQPPLYSYHDIYPGNHVGKNVANGFGLLVDEYSTSPPLFTNGIISPDFYTNGADSIVVDYNAASGPMAYSNVYVGRGVGGGNDFKQIDNTNALTAFAAKVGGRLFGTGYGHEAYYNFTTGVSSYPSLPVQTVSSVANGINTSRVTFDGATYSRWSGSSSAPLLGIPTTGTAATSGALTVVFQFRAAGDAIGGTFIGGKNSNILIQVANASNANPGSGNILTLSMVDTTGQGTIFKAVSSLTARVADGLTTYIWVIDIDNYKCTFIKANANGVIYDPLLYTSICTGDHLQTVNGSTTFTLGAIYSNGTFLTGDVGAVLVHDGLPTSDILTSAGLGLLVGRDGLPVNYGNGTAVFGAQARVAINAAFGSWNANTQNAGSGGVLTAVPANPYTAAP